MPNFGFRDLIHTTVGRWRQCLSQIINFAKFREAKFMTYAQLTAEGVRLTAPAFPLGISISHSRHVF